jgi:hypothetical protein
MGHAAQALSQTVNSGAKSQIINKKDGSFVRLFYFPAKK